MSTHFPLFYAVVFAFLLILQLFNNCAGQDIEAVIRIDSSSPQTAVIKGRFTTASTQNFAFLHEYAGIPGLAERLSDLVLEDRAGHSVAYKQFIPGEYVADAQFVSWRYKLDLRPLKATAAAGHTSWISGDSGLLFLDDLLPILPVKKEKVLANVKIEVPNGWTLSGGQKSFESANVDRSIFIIGRNLRDISVPSSGRELRVATQGEWRFADEDAKEFVSQIYQQYGALFGGPPNGGTGIYLSHFPQNVGFGIWEGDTRGSVVSIVSSDMPFRTQSLQRLHEQLRHEMFHLWLPNSVNLSGKYDWFYEGFALYQSLKTGVAVNRLRFDDFLDTLSRAYIFDSALANRRSLIDLSANRTSGGDTDLYARGMVVAFLTDIQLLQSSSGKRNVGSILRTIYERYHNAEPSADGNKAVLETIAQPKITQLVQGTDQIDWSGELQAAGIEQTEKNASVKLSVTSKPSGRQKQLLEKLGYNNWRKSNVSPK
jgi:hypothetical protein